MTYLVLGSIPSTGWKHGNYGNKIVKAKQLIENGANLKIISEKDFMVGLEDIATLDSGEIDEKLLICRYKALFENGDIFWNEKKEGTASFAKLLQDIPLRTKLT